MSNIVNLHHPKKEIAMPSKEYKGFTIELSETNFMFRITGGDWPSNRTPWFASMDEATTAIDAVAKVREKEKSTKEKLSIPVLNASGDEIVLRGIHAGTGKVLTSDSGYDGAIYPRVDWLRDLLKERDQLSRRQKQITAILSDFTIAGIRKHGKVDADHYDALVNVLKGDLLRSEEKAKIKQPEA